LHSLTCRVLGKTVILTGSVIPLSQEPNDASDNLGGALLMAGHFDIPEVTVFFRDQLFRGNRSTKISATGLNAFNSCNFPPLAHVGIYINVRWDLIRSPQETEQDRGFRIFTEMSNDVGILTVFPGITAALVRNALAPPLRGCVLRTFGSGNLCDDASIIDALADATARGVVLVNVTQCAQGAVLQGTYQVSSYLDRINVTPGHDMTTEAALTKLAWTLARFRDPRVVRAKMALELRGCVWPHAYRVCLTRCCISELTQPFETRYSWRPEGRVLSSRRDGSLSSSSSSSSASPAASVATTSPTSLSPGDALGVSATVVTNTDVGDLVDDDDTRSRAPPPLVPTVPPINVTNVPADSVALVADPARRAEVIARARAALKVTRSAAAEGDADALPWFASVETASARPLVAGAGIADPVLLR
jgi:hypothetical protein